MESGQSESHKTAVKVKTKKHEGQLLGYPEVTANIYGKSRNFPDTDTQNLLMIHIFAILHIRRREKNKILRQLFWICWF